MNNKRISFAKIWKEGEIPYLLEFQQKSFNKFIQPEFNETPEKRKNIGLESVFREIFPIEDVHGRFELRYHYYKLDPPRYTPEESRVKDLTYGSPLKVKLELIEYNLKDITLSEEKEFLKLKDALVDNEKTHNKFYFISQDIVHPKTGNTILKAGTSITPSHLNNLPNLGIPVTITEKSVKHTISQEVYLCEIPLMTEEGNFVINGVDRVVVSQLHRSPGVFFDEVTIGEGRSSYIAEIIPYRGPWITFSIELNETLMVTLDGNRKFPVSILLRALGYVSNEQILRVLFKTKKMKVPKEEFVTSELMGKYVPCDIIDNATGEVLIEAGKRLDEEKIEKLYKKGIEEVEVIDTKKDEVPIYITNCFDKDKTQDLETALKKIYRYLRGSYPSSSETARDNFYNMYFDRRRFDLSLVGRKKINKKLGLNIPENVLSLTKEDFVETIRYLIKVIEGEGEIDDIDHLANRRVRGVGEMLENQFRIALTRLGSTIKEKMMIKEEEKITPQDLINSKQVSSVINSFFATNQLSQYMDQVNPLSELTHKRRLSALGVGGLSKETAGFEVRDVHYTHYGRICPIETPESENIGLVVSLSTFAKVNDDGFIETPYRKVVNGKVIHKPVYLDAEEEEEKVDTGKYEKMVTIGQANITLDKNDNILDQQILARRKGSFPIVNKDEIDYVDYAPMQMVSVSAALIPFLEHDDANRALMGSNMQRQAVPLIKTEAPIVGTGLEEKVARDSGAVVIAKRSGIVHKVSSYEIWIKPDEITAEPYDVYELKKFKRTTQNTCINQRPIVKEGERVKEGQIIADGYATSNGELALGANLLVAFMPYFGWNYEDAIVVSERLLKEDILTSFHIEELVCEARETKLGPEELTREYSNIPESKTRHLDERGIVVVGTEVKPDDILVGKVSPKGETELTHEEKLMLAIFGKKAEDVKDTSLRVPAGLSGIVVDTKLFSREPKKELVKSLKNEKERKLEEFKKKKIELLSKTILGEKIKSDIKDEKGNVIIQKNTVIGEKDLKKIEKNPECLKNEYPKIYEMLMELNREMEHFTKQIDHKIFIAEKGDELPPGTIKKVKVFIGQRRKLSIGDKLSGRHGNKGVVSIIVPEEDMPYLEDGTPVDVVLNPLGVPSRMNIGQIFEALLGLAAQKLGIKVASPVFDGANIDEVKEYLRKAGLPEDGQVTLYDGKTGEKFGSKITVGVMYLMKLNHMVDDKVHARATGPYSLITQQPLGGKAQAGGQRFGEMEVWALEAYGAANTLQEMLTVKSDDVTGRHKTYEAIVKGENLPKPGIPASFNVLLKELNGLGLNVQLLKKGGGE
uniref:DNA-directed RNA polymerase subunit beta n=1 Tax=candidate division WOR-3 bacterium TaxID=2052148 RepID=A0A7C4Y9M4_UNCW3